MPRKVRVAGVGEIPDGEGKAFTCGNHRVAVFNIAGRYYAISDTCPHAGGPLSDGWLDGTEVTCPWHGWSFDVQYTDNDPGDGVSRYRIHVEGDDINIEVPD
jgi:nitrite reductase (NADH) small subunit